METTLLFVFSKDCEICRKIKDENKINILNSKLELSEKILKNRSIGKIIDFSDYNNEKSVLKNVIPKFPCFILLLGTLDNFRVYFIPGYETLYDKKDKALSIIPEKDTIKMVGKEFVHQYKENIKIDENNKLFEIMFVKMKKFIKDFNCNVERLQDKEELFQKTIVKNILPKFHKQNTINKNITNYYIPAIPSFLL